MTRRRARRVKNVKNSTMSRSIPLCLVMIGQAGAQRRSDMWRFEVGDVGRWTPRRIASHHNAGARPDGASRVAASRMDKKQLTHHVKRARGSETASTVSNAKFEKYTAQMS